jgi:GT2 family glycosyltransferase
METFFFSGAAFLLNAPKYHEVGPFDESLFLYYEEIDYAFRLAARGEKVLFDPTWSVTHDYALSTASGRKMRLLFKNRPTVLGRYAPNLWRRLALLGPSRGPRDEKGRKRILSILLPRLSLGFHTRQFHPAIRLMANILAVPCALLIKAILRKRLARD